MREVRQYHLILTKTDPYLCSRGHESALCRGISQFKSFKSNLLVKRELLTYHLYATQFSRSPQPFKSDVSAAWKICHVCVWLFMSMKGFRIQNMPFSCFVSSDDEIRNLNFINFVQTRTAIQAIIWLYNKVNWQQNSHPLFFYEDLK